MRCACVALSLLLVGAVAYEPQPGIPYTCALTKQSLMTHMQAEACSLKDGKHEGHPNIESLASGAFGFASKLADFVRTLVGASSSTLPLKFAYYINNNDSAQECLSMRSGRSMPAGAGRPVCDLAAPR